jgi:hypothetical protein
MYTNGNKAINNLYYRNVPLPLVRTQQYSASLASVPASAPASAPASVPASAPASYVSVNRQGKFRVAALPVGPAIPDPSIIAHSQRMRWGAPTWTLFHVMAAQISPQKFPYIRDGLLEIITAICGNLPCPDCSNHATEYLRKINYNMIQTPDHLRAMLYEFHNSVNMRKNVAFFPSAQLTMYNRMDIREVVYRFMHFFENRHTNNSRMMAHSFSRGLQAQRIRDWFNTNWLFFQPV